MIHDFIVIDPDSDAPLWMEIYKGIAEALERQMIEPSERLPSIRNLSEGLELAAPLWKTLMFTSNWMAS